MPLFKKKPENLIPPVPAPAPSSSNRSPHTYVASRDGDPYNAPISKNTPDDYSSNLLADRYNRNRGVGDVYSRGTAELDKDRNELFSGYNPAKSGSGRFFDGPDILAKPPADGEANEDDVEGIKQQTRFVKQESVNSTRNALRLAREAEETGRNTLSRLGDQSEKLANTERYLDISKGHSQRAADKTDELKQLNRSIFRPVITFNKEAKRAAEQSKTLARYEEEREERERVAMDLRESQDRIGKTTTYGRGDDSDEFLGRQNRFKTAEQLSVRKEQRKRYQFESNASDDELEDEMDNNLDEISEVANRLKALGTAMGNELDQQNGRIENIIGKTDRLDDKIRLNTERLKRIK